MGAFYITGGSTPGGPGERALRSAKAFYSGHTQVRPEWAIRYSPEARYRYLPFLVHEMFLTVTNEVPAPTQADQCFAKNFDKYAERTLFTHVRQRYILLCQFLKKEQCELDLSQAETSGPLSFDAPPPTDSQLRAFFHTLHAPHLTKNRVSAMDATFGKSLSFSRAISRSDLDSLAGNLAAIGASIALPRSAVGDLLPGSGQSGEDSLNHGVIVAAALGAIAGGTAIGYGLVRLMQHMRGQNTAQMNARIRERAVDDLRRDLQRNRDARAQRLLNDCPIAPGGERDVNPECNYEPEEEISDDSVAAEEDEITDTITSASSDAEAAEAATAAESAAEASFSAGAEAAAEASVAAAAEVTVSVAFLPEIAIGAAVAGLGYLIYHFASNAERDEVGVDGDTPDLQNYVALLKKAAQAPVAFDAAEEQPNKKHAEIHDRVTAELLTNLIFDSIDAPGSPKPFIKLPSDSRYFKTSTDFHHLLNLTGGAARITSILDNTQTDLPTTMGPVFAELNRIDALQLPVEYGRNNARKGYFAVDPRKNGTQKLLRLFRSSKDRLGATLYSRDRDGRTLERSWKTSDLAFGAQIDGGPLGARAAVSNTVSAFVAEANGKVGTDIVQLSSVNGTHWLNVYSSIVFSGRQMRGDTSGCSLDRHKCMGYAPYSSSQIEEPTPRIADKLAAFPADMDADGIDEIVILSAGATADECTGFSASSCTRVHVLKLLDKHYKLVASMKRRAATRSEYREYVNVLALAPDGKEAIVFSSFGEKGNTPQPSTSSGPVNISTVTMKAAGGAGYALQATDTSLSTDLAWPANNYINQSWIAIDSVAGNGIQDLALLNVSDYKDLSLRRYRITLADTGRAQVKAASVENLDTADHGLYATNVWEGYVGFTTSSVTWDASSDLIIFYPGGSANMTDPNHGAYMHYERGYGQPHYQFKEKGEFPTRFVDGFNNYLKTVPLNRVAPNTYFLPNEPL